MLDNRSPCKPDCPRRSPTCHGECWDYFEYDLFNIINRELQQQEKEKERNLLLTSRHMKKKKRTRQHRRDNQ